MQLRNALHRAEFALGKIQYRTAMAGLARIAGLIASETVIDGVRVPYFARRSTKPGTTVVLVHGFGGDKESWLQMVLSISRTRGVIIPDLPGFGGAGMIPRERASARAQARVLAQLLDRMNEREAHFVGNSMGGGISQRFAQDFPERTRSITLVGSVGPTVEKSPYFLALDRGENPLVLREVEQFEAFMALVSQKPPPLPRTLRRFLAEDRIERAAAFDALFDGWRHPAEGDGPPERPEELGAIQTPALVIHGALDQVIHPATGRALAAHLPRARLEILANIGHIPQLEASKRVAGLFEDFARGVE